MCGVRMTFGRPCRLETNGSPAAFGSSANTSSAAPAMCPLSRCSRSESWSTTMPRHRLRNRLRGRIWANCSAPKSPALPGRPSTCRVTVSATASSSSRLCAALRVAQRQLVGDVVEVDPHAQRLRDHRQLAADVAVADDAEGPAAHLVGALGRLVPDAGVHGRVLVGQPPGQGDDLGDHQLDHAAGVGERGVEHHRAPLGGGGEVDLVGADAERPDRQQVRGRIEHGPGHRGLGPDAEQLDAREGGDQLRLVERAGDRLDGDPPLGEQPHPVGVDVLQQ